MRNVLLALLLLLTGATWAQVFTGPPAPPNPPQNPPAPNGPPVRPPNVGPQAMPLYALRQPPMQFIATPEGFFMLTNGKLAKYGSRSAKPIIIDLFEKLPPFPTGDAPEKEWRNYADAQMKRLNPASIAAQDSELIIADAEQLWVVDIKQMSIKSKVNLPVLLPPFGRPPMPQQAPPRLEVSGKTAFLIRGNQLTTIDLSAGKQLFDGPLPEEMLPANAEGLLRHFGMGRPPMAPPGGQVQPPPPGPIFK